MARDYARQTKRATTAPAAGWVWLVAGLTMGLTAMILIAWHMQSPAPNKETLASTSVHKESTATLHAPVREAIPAVEEKPRFDFYTLLSNMGYEGAPASEVIEPASKADTPAVFAPLPSTDMPLYIVELDRLHSKITAESLHAKLLSQGFQPALQASESGKEAYRLYLGPFASEHGAQQTVDTLQSQGFQGTLMVKYQAN